MNRTFALALGVLALTASGATLAQNAPAGNLQIHWVDVEGGAATLFVSPTGESLLFDTGYPGNGDRDAKRILAAAQKAGLRQIDHVVISHWHGDHVGGLDALAKMIPLGKFYDHGDGVEPADRERLECYKSDRRHQAHDLESRRHDCARRRCRFRVLVSEGPVIASPINGGGANPLCTNALRQAPGGPRKHSHGRPS